MLSIEQLHSHTCAELVGMCKELGLPHSGRRKQLLVQALFDYQRNNGGIPLPVLARNSFRSHNAAAARYQQQQQALLHQQQQQSGQMLPHMPSRPSPANGSVAAPVNFPLQKQMPAQPPVTCAVAGQSSAGGLCGSGGPGFPPPRAGAAAVGGGGTGSHHAPGHAAPAAASAGGTTSSSDPGGGGGGGGGQGLFSRCICKGAAAGSPSRGRVSHAKTLKCKICGYLSHLSCYPEATGLAAHKFVCSTCRMKRLDPFYPVWRRWRLQAVQRAYKEEEVLWETRLEGSHYSVYVFSYALRKWRAEGKEVIVRCMQLDQPLLYQTWPKSIQIAINGRTEETVAAPSWEHKRRDMPVVITQFLKNGKNRLEFWWTNYEEPKAFHLAVLLCTYSSPEALVKTLELRNHVGEAEARRRVLSIVTNKNGRSDSTPQEDDDDVTCMEVTRRIKLLCPITFTRIAVPCRGGSCMHLQCFDLWGFLLVTRNTKAFNTRWKCPECQLYVRPDELVIDDFVLKILKETPEDATVVELEADGSYRVVSEQELKEESKRAEAQRLRAAGACRVKRAIEEEPSSATSSAPAALPEDGPTKKAFEIVEMLSSSEDEEEALAIESSSSSAAPAVQTPDASAAPAAAGESVATTGTAATGAAPVVTAASAAGPVAVSSTSTRPAAQETHAGAESASTAAYNAIPPASGALPPALVSSLRSAAAAASAAAPGGLLFSSAATIAAHHQQHQQRQEPAAATQERRRSFSPEEEAEEGEDEEDSAIRGGRFYKRRRRTAVSPASPVSPTMGENPAVIPQRQVVPGGSTSEGPSAAAAAAAGGSLQRRTSSPAAARAAGAGAAAGGAGESAQGVSTKTDAFTATSFPSASSEMLQEQQPVSGEGGDVVVVISSDEEEEEDPVAAAWTPVVSPQQQRRQQRRQQEQERRRLQDEERQEQRKFVAQAVAAARQHARGRETLPEGTAAEVGAGATQPQNVSLPQAATLTLLSPPAATDAGAQALLSNLHLSFPATPPRRAAAEHAVSKDTDSETHVGSKAAELLQLLLERQRQELEQREKMQPQEVEQQQQLSLHRLASLSSEEGTSHHTAASCWQAPERRAESSSSPADAPKNSSSSRNLSWTFGEVTSTGRGTQSSSERTEDLATGPPLSKSAAATDSPAAADSGGTALPPPGSASAHRSSAPESSGSEQQSSHLQDSRPAADAANLFFAPASLSPASFATAVTRYSFPCVAPPPACPPGGGAAAGVAVAAPFAAVDVSHVSSNTVGSRFGGPDARVAPPGSYYYYGPSSSTVASSPVLQQEQVSTQVQQQPFPQQLLQQQPRQEHMQQPGSCGDTGEAAFPIYGNVHNSSDASADPSSVLGMYSHALQVQRPQQILEQLQEQVQQAMQESVQLQQHVKEQHGVQEQRLEQQAVHDLQHLQQPRRRLPVSRETVEHADAAEKQPLRENPAMVDIRERGETRSDARKKTARAPVAGAYSSSNRSRRVSARGSSSSRSNSMESAHTDADAGHGREENEQYRSESCRQPFPAAQGAFLHAVSHKADVSPAPAKERVEGRPSSSLRVSTDVRNQPLHEHLRTQQQHSSEYDQLQRKQQQQQLRGGMTVVEGGTAGVLEMHPAPGKTPAPPPPAAASERTGPALASAGSQLVWPAAAPVAAPARSPCNPVASSAVSSDRKTPAAGEATLTTGATAAGPAAATGTAANPSVAGGIQGADGARRGPRMSLPPRTCIAGLRPDSSGPSKSTASSESGKGASSSAAMSSVASTSSAASVVASSAAAPRAGVSPPAASTESVGKQQSGLSRSTTNVAAAAPTTPSVAGTAGTAATLQPRSPARRLLVPPVPPPLCSRSNKQAGSAGSSGQEDRGSHSASKQQGQSSSVSNPPSGSSCSSSQPDQEGKIHSRLPPAAAATARTESSTGGATAAAAATSTTVSPAPAPAPRPPGATAAAARSSDAAVRETGGRQATLRDTGNGSAFVSRWSSHTNVNSKDDRSSVAVSDVADRGLEPEKRTSGSGEGQPGSSNHSKTEGMCSAYNVQCSQQTDCASLAVSGRPAAAVDENVCSAALHLSQREQRELRTRSSGSSIEGSGQAEPSEDSQSSKHMNIADYSTEGSSGVQSRSGGSSRLNCSSSSLAAVTSDCRNPRQETEGAVSCCGRAEDLQRGDDLPGRHTEVEREVFAARHGELREAWSKKSGISAVGTPCRDSKFCSSDGDSKAAQTAGTADTADGGRPQRTESREAAAAADQPPLVPSQAAGGRCRVSVVLAHHGATHPVPPPAGYFSTADCVSVSSTGSGPRGSAEAAGDELHAGAGVDSGTNDSDVSQSQHHQQKGGAADSSRLCVTKPYTLATSVNLGALSCPVTEHIPESGAGASGGTVPSLRAPADDSFSENENSLLGGAAPPLNIAPAGSNLRDAPLRHSCGEVTAAFSSSLYAAAEQAGSALRAQQEPQFVSEAATKDLKGQFVPVVTREGPEREDSGIRAASLENVVLRRDVDTDVRHSSTPLLHSLPQLQPHAQLVWQRQRETTSAASNVREVGPTADFTHEAALSRRKAGVLCTEDENGREVEGDRGSEGVARCDDRLESSEGLAALQRTEWERERGFCEHLAENSETRSTLNAQGLLQRLPSTAPTPVAAGTDMHFGGDSFRTFGRM